MHLALVPLYSRLAARFGYLGVWVWRHTSSATEKRVGRMQLRSEMAASLARFFGGRIIERRFDRERAFVWPGCTVVESNTIIARSVVGGGKVVDEVMRSTFRSM